MTYQPEEHHRRSLRLKNYDYSAAGAYFVTFVTHGRKCLFGNVVEDEIQLNRLGHLVFEEWERSVVIREEIELDAFVVMPNHFHGIVVFTDSAVGATGRSPSPGPSRRSVGAF